MLLPLPSPFNYWKGAAEWNLAWRKKKKKKKKHMWECWICVNIKVLNERIRFYLTHAIKSGQGTWKLIFNSIDFCAET